MKTLTFTNLKKPNQRSNGEINKMKGSKGIKQQWIRHQNTREVKIVIGSDITRVNTFQSKFIFFSVFFVLQTLSTPSLFVLLIACLGVVVSLYVVLAQVMLELLRWNSKQLRKMSSSKKVVRDFWYCDLRFS